jgi:hypothetical protein
LGDAPDSLPHPLWSSPFVQIGSDNNAVVEIASVGRFWIYGTRLDPRETQIVLQPAPGAQLFEIETILLGTVAGIVLHLRSMLPLHASCVVLDGRAIACCGPCAVGKSALAAALVRHGALLLSDDLSVADVSQGAVRALPGTKQARLWPDVMNRLEVPLEQRFPTRLGHPKHAVALPTAELRAWPLTLMVRIEAGTPGDEPILIRRHGLPSLFPFSELVFQREIGRSLGNRAHEFRHLTGIADHAAIFTLQRTRVLGDLERCAELILSAFRGAA